MEGHILADKVRRPCKGTDQEMSFIYSFLNSEDVARLCREIGHRFTSLQSAYLIDHSYRHTLEEKRRAFQWVTDHMPDEEMLFGSEGRAAIREGRKPETLHRFLEKYVHLQNQCLGEFFDVSENCVYQCSVYESGCGCGTYESVHHLAGEYGNGREWFKQDGYYKSAEEALDAARDRDDRNRRVRVCKHYMDKTQRCISVIFDSNRAVTEIEYDSGMSDEESDIMLRLDEVCFVCPVPFQKGDIVCASSSTYMADGPFVFLGTWYEGKTAEEIRKYLKSADSSDMTAYGYFQDDRYGRRGRIYWECMHDYVSLEYYRGNFKRGKRILKAVSNFLKGELDLDYVLNAYHIILNEENAGYFRKALGITQEGLCLAGLEPEGHLICAENTTELRAYQGLFGFCVGDALGVPVEFSDRNERKEDPVREMRAYGTHRQPAGTWSDDTSLMLCLIDAVNQGYSIQKTADNFVDFYKNGAFTPYGKVFDIGISTREAIEKMCGGESPARCGGTSAEDNGNGSLMRVLPLAFYGLRMEGPQLISLVEEVSSLTHGHRRSVFACIFYVKFAIRLMAGDSKTEALERTIGFMEQYCAESYAAEWEYFDRILRKRILELSENDIRSTGYVVDTLEAALWAFFGGKSYREIVQKAVNLGGDTDTVAAIAGGLAGIYCGVYGEQAAKDDPAEIWEGIWEKDGLVERETETQEKDGAVQRGAGIPQEWIQCIAKKEELYRMFRQFYQVCKRKWQT